jgi:Zn-dependent M28 family amino/carboxypeptidase
MPNKSILIVSALFIIFLPVAAVIAGILPDALGGEAPVGFDGERAYQDVLYQESLGPRLPGSPAHEQAVNWMVEELDSTGWATEIQETEMLGHPIRNVIAKRGEGRPWIILGAHYDSRFFADRDSDPSQHMQPVLGANDGASGVAVLLELARSLPPVMASQVWLVFFDAEDQGRIEGWDWILGSRAFAESLQGTPDSVIIVDMIGDADLNIYYERNSDAELSQTIFETAHELGYEDQFIQEEKYSILDDHTPFLELGIPAVDLIDFDYPYWHTTADTADKVSSESLSAVGVTLRHWILQQK